MLVTGGPTSAGTKRVKTLEPWTCKCIFLSATVRYQPVWHSGDTYSCPDCGERRPDAS